MFDIDLDRFLYDGTRIGDDDTPASLGMEDNDSIDVMVERKLYSLSVTKSSDLLSPCLEVGGDWQ